MSRALTLKLKPEAGQIHQFWAIVGGRVVISGDGTAERTFDGEIPSSDTVVKTWVEGVPGSKYSVTVDLPGTADDFSIKHTLSGTIQTFEFIA